MTPGYCGGGKGVWPARYSYFLWILSKLSSFIIELSGNKPSCLPIEEDNPAVVCCVLVHDWHPNIHNDVFADWTD